MPMRGRLYPADRIWEHLRSTCMRHAKWSMPHLLRCLFRSARGWKTVCALINMTALHPEASQTSFEAFALVCKDDKLLTPANFAPLLETALVFVDRHAKVCHSHSNRFRHLCLRKLWSLNTDMQRYVTLMATSLGTTACLRKSSDCCGRSCTVRLPAVTCTITHIRDAILYSVCCVDV